MSKWLVRLLLPPNVSRNFDIADSQRLKYAENKQTFKPETQPAAAVKIQAKPA